MLLPEAREKVDCLGVWAEVHMENRREVSISSMELMLLKNLLLYIYKKILSEAKDHVNLGFELFFICTERREVYL